MTSQKELQKVFEKLVTVPDLSKLKNVLFVGPHPDDIEFGCGGLVSKIKENGGTVHYLIVTDGSAGTDDPSVTPKMLKDTRYSESRDAAKYMGADTVDFGELEDGGTYSVEEAVKVIAKFILKYFPEAVFTTDPHYRNECHSDHLKVGEATRMAVQLVGYPLTMERHGIEFDSTKGFPRNIIIAQYFTDEANCFVELSKKNLNDKIEALKLHKSQMVGDMAMFIPFVAFEATMVGKSKGLNLSESFQVIMPLCQHVINYKYQL